MHFFHFYLLISSNQHVYYLTNQISVYIFLFLFWGQTMKNPTILSRPLSLSLCPSRPVQPGVVGWGHVRPEAAGPAAARRHPGPTTAGRGGRLRGLQHRAQRPELLPARKSCPALHPPRGPPDTHMRLHSPIVPRNLAVVWEIAQTRV